MSYPPQPPPPQGQPNPQQPYPQHPPVPYGYVQPPVPYGHPGYPPAQYGQPPYMPSPYAQQQPLQVQQVGRAVTRPAWSVGEVMAVVFTCGLALPFVWLSRRSRTTYTRYR